MVRRHLGTAPFCCLVLVVHTINRRWSVGWTRGTEASNNGMSWLLAGCPRGGLQQQSGMQEIEAPHIYELAYAWYHHL